MLKNRNSIFVLLFVVSILASGIIASADYQGSIGINTGGGVINITVPTCQEDWSGSTWGQCVNGTQTFICFDKNQCGTTNLEPALCGTTQSCQVQPTSNGGGGGYATGGSGSSSGGGSSNNVLPSASTTNTENQALCVENWQCGTWSNAKDQCGTRTCTDVNDCGTTYLKPVTKASCPNFFSTIISFLTGNSVAGTTAESTTTAGGIAILILIALIVIAAVLVVFFNIKKKK